LYIATSGSSKPGAIGQVGQAGIGAVLGVYYGVRDGARIVAESAKVLNNETQKHKREANKRLFLDCISEDYTT